MPDTVFSKPIEKGIIRYGKEDFENIIYGVMASRVGSDNKGGGYDKAEIVIVEYVLIDWKFVSQPVHVSVEKLDLLSENVS